MLFIEIPSNYEAERRYILSVMFKEFLGLDIQIQLANRQNVSITMNDGRELIVTDGLFASKIDHWLQPASLPKQPLKVWNIAKTDLAATTVKPEIPVIYGNNPENSNFFQSCRTRIYLGLDIFGSAFFMLTRYEEVVKMDRDQHNRFPAKASLAYQEGFLDRPIVNEYLEIIWACLKHLWSKLKCKPRKFKVYLSHDVDRPFMYATGGVLQLTRLCGSALIKQRKPLQAANNIWRWLKINQGEVTQDPYNSFDLIMDVAEKHNLKSAFYFITERSSSRFDGVYPMNHPLIRQLLHKINDRGHEIGLHTSYNTYRDFTQHKKEFTLLKEICAVEGIEQDYWGGRQHYLRWETPTTFQNWNDSGLDYDTTLSFADVAGFRCGVCYEFTTFNVKTSQHLKVRERPLIIMECTVIGKNYMNLSIENGSALQTMIKLKQHCQLFSGDFTLLWHNSRLVEEQEVELYRQIISR